MTKEKQQKIFNKLYPWYTGFSLDLLFYYAIDTLFFKEVVGISDSEILLSTSIALIIRLALQPLLLWIIEKVGNIPSIRLGTLLLFSSSVILTFSKSFIAVTVGKTIYNVSFVFLHMMDVILKNNLEFQNRTSDYTKMRTYSTTIYSVVTMLISIVASFMFNLNAYFPMYCCMACSFATLVMSLFIFEETPQKAPEVKVEKSKKFKINKLIFLSVLTYSMFYAILTSTQLDGKLFIQNNIAAVKTIAYTSIMIGVIQLISRILRVVSNLLYNFISKKLEKSFGMICSILLLLSNALFLAGCAFDGFWVKISLMSLGFFITLMLRDPFKIYMQNFALDHIEPEKRQSVISYMQFFFDLLRAIMSLVFGIILIDMGFVIEYIILFALTVLEIIFFAWLLKILKVTSPQEN